MGLSSDILPRRPSSIRNRRNNIRSHLDSNKRTRNRRGTLATGCGAIKICLRRSKNTPCKVIPHSAACRRRDSRFCAIDCNASQIFRHNSSCAC